MWRRGVSPRPPPVRLFDVPMFDVPLLDVPVPDVPFLDVPFLDVPKVRCCFRGDANPNRDRPPISFGLTNRADELIHLVFDILERRRL